MQVSCLFFNTLQYLKTVALESIRIALHKRDRNYCSTGGGAPEDLTTAEANAMEAMVSRKSSMVNGIPGAIEIGLDTLDDEETQDPNAENNPEVTL